MQWLCLFLFYVLFIQIYGNIIIPIYYLRNNMDLYHYTELATIKFVVLLVVMCKGFHTFHILHVLNKFQYYGMRGVPSLLVPVRNGNVDSSSLEI